MNKIKLIVTTPEKIIVNNSFNEILLPGISGDFELFYNHENFISKLRIGIISVDANNKLTPSFIVSESFATFSQETNTCDVTAEYAVTISEIKSLNKSDIIKKIESSFFETEKKVYQFILSLNENI